ncbi:hypothetical protein [Bradyrhizobium betae]|uniref:Uncharacterized protein n=1 Tax=Bradyrhizobium betae TaxID=244734 RepID=A0A5P6P6V2_9BRAD|nr:hypothetical protein [Bradyrhizobium betae]MCS3731312.1 hypothetical protein [Bradyrhizobium betae]QFI73916.1 hypothetical protein F8237_16745 [Bradyrhizobium betae]
MPIFRYLIFVGGLLLSLLFAADHFLPPAVEPISAAEVDRSIIRISSTRPVPEKIVFDVSHPSVPAASVVADVEHDEQPPREALAMMAPEPTPETQPARTVTEHITKPRHAARPSRTSHRPFERRLAFEHREFPGGW